MDKPKAIIVDIDGTLTTDPLTIPEELKYTREGKEKFYEQIEYYKPSTMKTNMLIAQLIKMYIMQGAIAIFVTAREATPRTLVNTKTYLKYLFGNDFHLEMRRFNDFRPNYEVKEDIYNTFIKDEVDVLFVLEDEDKNIEMFKKLGLQVLKVEK